VWLPPSPGRSESCVSVLLVARPSTQLCTNHLVWVVCRPVWVSEACQLFLVPSQNSNTPLYASKCCELGSMPWVFPLPLFSTWTHISILWRIGSASYFVLCWYIQRLNHEKWCHYVFIPSNRTNIRWKTFKNIY
jgi:hypothetical protein